MFFLPQTSPQLHSINAKAGEHRRSEPCGLDVTISANCDWSVAIFNTSLKSQESYLTLRNLTLQTCLSITRNFFRLHSTFAWLYNAAASPASRLRSAGSLAIIILFDVYYSISEVVNSLFETQLLVFVILPTSK